MLQSHMLNYVENAPLINRMHKYIDFKNMIHMKDITQ